MFFTENKYKDDDAELDSFPVWQNYH